MSRARFPFSGLSGRKFFFWKAVPGSYNSFTFPRDTLVNGAYPFGWELS
jgi:hypothetical protein